MDATPRELRERIRAGGHDRPTAGLASGYVQANLVVLPARYADDFLLFCTRNPRPCPLLEVTDTGSPEPRATAPGADLRTDLPRYRVYRHGELAAEPADVVGLWSQDLVAFLLGCSFTFESALLRAGIPVRHLEQGRNVPMYRTAIPCRPAGAFSGPLVVSMRPMPPADALRAATITARFPARLRRPGRAQARRRAGLLGLRGDPAGGRGGEPARADAHPRTGPHVRHRPARRVLGRPVASGP